MILEETRGVGRLFSIEGWRGVGGLLEIQSLIECDN